MRRLQEEDEEEGGGGSVEVMVWLVVGALSKHELAD